MLTVIVASHGLQMEQLRRTPLYFVAEGPVKTEIGRVHVVKKIELSGLFAGIEEIKTRIRDTRTLEIKANITYEAEHVKEELWKETLALRGSADKLSQLVGGKTRTKRGLLDIGGEALKFVFGTMSASDAKEITAEFYRLNDKTDTVKQQMDSAIVIMQKLNDANEVLQRSQEQERSALNKKWKQLNEYVKEEVAIEDIREMHNSMSRWIYALKSEIEQLHNALMFLKLGLVDPYIIDVEEIHQKTKGMRLNYDVKVEDIGNLIKASNISSFVNTTSQTVYIAIGLPVAGNSSYELYSVIRIPQMIGGQKKVIEQANKFLLVAEDKRSYWQGDNFKHLRIGKTLLTKRRSMSTLLNNVSCEVSVFQFMTDKGCVYKPWEKQLEVEIITNGGYLMVWFESRIVSFTCSNEKGNFSINEPTLVQLEEGCEISGDGFSITGTVQEGQMALKDMAIKMECCSGFDLNITKSSTWDDTPEVEEQVVIENVNDQLQELKTRLKNYKKKEVEPLYLVTAPTVLILFAVATGLVFWYVVIIKARDKVNRITDFVNNQNLEMSCY